MFRRSLSVNFLAKRPLTLRSSPVLQQFRAQSTDSDKQPYWARVARWKDVSTEDFKSYRWQMRNSVAGREMLQMFLHEALPDSLGDSKNPLLRRLKTRDDFIQDALAGLKLAPMAVRLTPQILSQIDWERPLDDPIRKQFLPLKSGLIPDHKALTLDSLNEEADSPVPGLVHRYPGRALFLATSVCPVYCRYCTRSYAVGGNTGTVSKSPQRPNKQRWEAVFRHIENDQSLEDIVVSGGDAYYLKPEDLRNIGERLLGINHIRRVRFASKGLAVAPGRILDKNDDWANTIIDLSKLGRGQAKQVCLHTHFNHPNEITWITKEAANYLFSQGVIVRNQSVLLRGVNDDIDTLKNLIEGLARINIQPYYVYQCDMVRGIEDLRTPLSTLMKLDKDIRGTISGFMTPSFVVDLPGGGGKRLVSTVESYDEGTGVSVFKAPGLPFPKNTLEYRYLDPAPIPEDPFAIDELHRQQDLAFERHIKSQKKILPKFLDQEGNRPSEIHASDEHQTEHNQEALDRPRPGVVESKPEKKYDHLLPHRMAPPTAFPNGFQSNQPQVYPNDQAGSYESRVSARGYHDQAKAYDTSISGETSPSGSQ